ncbi:hypothetical protein QWY99_14915 [Flavobacterium branchiarum]|uniref:Uncharacterized protein n=1 Tax=Flavobacterium branchiarum TaxID=1114870 RepID=A0ABV5FMT1_9FLAO|nr:hypothetical protein [Flavobacterium branchiarum]MDN3674348.1 hypothetical protein [Flavobacterium branchiarum]
MKNNTKLLASKEHLAKGLSDAKTDMIKWLFGLFFALALMIIGL